MAINESQSVRVHRCRFVDWTPSPITSIAFPPTPIDSSKKLPTGFPVLAVGRANGNIELYEWTSNPPPHQTYHGYVLRRVFAAPVPSKVDTIVLTLRDHHAAAGNPYDALRLFSMGGGSELLEWDLNKGIVKRSISSQGGSIWSMAANPASTKLAIGCEDGCARIVSLEKDMFLVERKFEHINAKILSIAWGPPIPHQPQKMDPAHAFDSDTDDEDERRWVDTWLVAGCSDSSVRKWDAVTGRILDRMSTDRKRGDRTLVWAVGVLSDNTIVSGDSLGMVKFWDSVTCTQLQTFTAHGADVLALAIGPQGDSLYTAGVDQNITEFLAVNIGMNVPGRSTGNKRWIQSCSRSMHSHDVRSLATWPPYVPVVGGSKEHLASTPLLVSGGLDMSLVLSPIATPSSHNAGIENVVSRGPIATFEEGHYRRLQFVQRVVQVAHKARMLACMDDTTVSLWRIDHEMVHADMVHAEGGEPSGSWEKLAELDLKVKTNLTACALSSDGTWLAIADLYETRLFKLEDMDGVLQPRRVRAFSDVIKSYFGPEATFGATALSFSADGTKLIIGLSQGGLVAVVELNSATHPRILRVFDHHRQLDARTRLKQGIKARRNVVDVDSDISPIETSLEGVIVHLATSYDGQWLASTDLRGCTHVFNLDSIQYYCTLPTFPLPVQAMSFDPNFPQLLFLALPNNTVRVFDVEEKLFPEWSRPLTRSVTQRLVRLNDPVMGIAFHPSSNWSGTSAPSVRTVLLWGASWICKFRIGYDVQAQRTSRKRRRGLDEDEGESDHEPEAVPSGLDEGEDGEGKGPEMGLEVWMKYRNMLAVEFFDSKEMVIVERPFMDVMSKLPPAYFKFKYGT